MTGNATGERGENPDRLRNMETIVREHETALLRYATRILNNADTAQDIVQNVFIKLFKSRQGGSQPAKHMKAWLYRVTHNEAVDHIRRESRLSLLHERRAKEPVMECPNNLNCPSGSDERRDLVLQHLKRLHPREQQVVLLRLDEGLSYRDIAGITGRSEGNVGNILHHAVRKLSKSLEQCHEV